MARHLLRAGTLRRWVRFPSCGEETPGRQRTEQSLDGLQLEEMLGSQEPRESRVNLPALDATPLALMHSCIGADCGLAQATHLAMRAKSSSDGLSRCQQEVIGE